MADTSLIFNIFAKDHTGKTFDRVGLAAKAAFAAAGFAAGAFAKQSITKFAEMQDAQGALQATYGKTADAFIDFANESADALNLSKREALGAAQTFANFGRAAGLTGKELQQFTTPLIERAADAASYFGGSTSDAIEAFGAALRGEMEPIRKYGVLLDDATLRAKALEMGLIDNVKNALTPQQKALAAQALILEKTAQAQGDVARTSDSMANRIKDAQQQMDDFQTSVGETLSLALGPLLGTLNQGLSLFNKLPQPVKSAAVVVGILGGAAIVAVPKIIAFKTALASWEGAGIKAKRGAGLAAAGATAVAAAMVATATVNAFSKAQVNAGRSSEQLAKRLELIANGAADDLGPAFKSFTGRAVEMDEALGLVRDNHWWDQLETGMAGVLGTTSNLGMAQESIEGVDAALSNMVSGGKADQAAKVIETLGIRSDEVATILPQYAAALDDAAAASKDVAPEVQGVTTKAQAQKRAVDALKDSWDLLSGLLDKRAAKRNWLDSMSEITAKVKEAGGKFDESTGKGRLFQDWLDTTVGNLQNYAQGFKNPLQQQKVMNEGLDKIRANLVKQGLSPAQVNEIMSGFDKVKGKVVALQQQAQKSTVLNITPRITGKGQITIGSGAAAKFIDVDYRERGGPVKAGQPYVVGERRPELFVPKTDGTILPSVPGAAGGVHIDTVNVIAAPGESVAESVPRAFRRVAFEYGMGAA